MTTLKDHQQAMVDLLAPGSAIPASASRLAHAMHDVLAHMVGGGYILDKKTYVIGEDNDATTPGLNDKALAADVEALRTDSPCVKPSPAEVRIKQLQNTINQLRASNAKLRERIADSAEAVDLWNRWSATPPEQAGVRKDDTQVCRHTGSATYYGSQCDHLFANDYGHGVATCVHCGATA